MERKDGSGGNSWERPDAPLGTLVYRAGLLSKEKLEAALSEGRQSGRRLGEILLQKGWIEEKDLARLLAGQKGLAFVSLKGRGFDAEVAQLLGEQVSRFHCALALEEEAGKVLVAIADPTDESAVADIGRELGRDFRLVVATASELRTALDHVFAPTPAAAPPLPPPNLTVAPPISNGFGDFGLRIVPAPGLPAPDALVAAPLAGSDAASDAPAVADAAPAAAEDVPAAAPSDDAPTDSGDGSAASLEDTLPGTGANAAAEAPSNDYAATPGAAPAAPEDGSPATGDVASAASEDDPAAAALNVAPALPEETHAEAAVEVAAEDGSEARNGAPHAEPVFAVAQADRSLAAAGDGRDGRDAPPALVVVDGPPAGGAPGDAPAQLLPLGALPARDALPAEPSVELNGEPRRSIAFRVPPAESQVQPEAELENHAEPKPENHAEPKPEPEAVVDPEAASEAEPLAEPADETVADPEVASGAEPDAGAESDVAPEPEPDPEAVAEPELAPEPEAVAEPAPEPEPEPGAVAEPEVAPEPEPLPDAVADPEAVAEPETLQTAEPARVPETEPESAPTAMPPHAFTAAAEAAPDAAVDERELPLRVVLVLDDEEEVEIGCYADEAAAEGAARDLIARVARLEEWPRVGRRFIRPDRVVSVVIRERMPWTGSRNRAAWGGASEPAGAGDASFGRLL